MDIQTFVAETIVQISKGILLAQEKTAEMPVLVNPPLGGEGSGQRVSSLGKTPQAVTFEMLVTVEKSKEIEGSGDIKILSFSADAGATFKNKDSAASKVSFTIPVVFPLERNVRKNQGDLR